jgi:uncharacterized protein (TIGR03437 family)
MRLYRLVFLALFPTYAIAQFLTCAPEITLPRDPGQVIIGGGRDRLDFRYSGVGTLFNAPNFVVVIPSQGTTPAAVQIGLNPPVVAQLQPGGLYSLFVGFTTVDVSPPSSIGCLVHLLVPKEPPPSIQSVLNAASGQPLLSPGTQALVIGSHLTGPTLSTSYDATASYPTVVAGTIVILNGIPAPLLSLSPDRIKVIVPYTLAGQDSVGVVVQRFGQVSDTFTSPLQDTSPGIFTACHCGNGPPPISQQDTEGRFTFNSVANPALPGMTLRIFATGAGVWTPPAQSDAFLFGGPFRTQPVSVTIGGLPASRLGTEIVQNRLTC